MNEKDFTLLDDYFNGLLPEGEADRLRERAASDGELTRELALRAEMEAFLKTNPARQRLADQMAGLGKEFFEKENEAAPIRELPKKGLRAIGGGRRFLLAAAAAIAVAVAAVLFFDRPGGPVYADFAQHEPLNLTTRSAGAVSEAEGFFQKKEYAAALAALEKLSAERPGDGQVELYRGICLIELGRTAEARAILAPLAEGASAWAVEARWYLALSFLKDGDLPKCREVLRKIRPGDNHHAAAQRILK